MYLLISLMRLLLYEINIAGVSFVHRNARLTLRVFFCCIVLHTKFSFQDHSSSEKSFKDDSLLNKSEERLFSPIFTSSLSFDKDDKALMISSAEPKESTKPRTPTSAGSSNIRIVVDTEQSDTYIRRTDSDNSLKGQRKKSLRDDEVDGCLIPSSNGVSTRNLPLEPSRSTSMLVTGGSSSSGSSSGSTGNLLGTAPPRQIRAINLNIRAPQGIPGRDVPVRKPFINPSAAAPSTEEEVDTNPLRRLRDSQSGFGRPMMTFRPVGGGSKQPVLPTTTTTTSNISSQDESNQRSLNMNLSFFDKLKEQEEQKLS